MAITDSLIDELSSLHHVGYFPGTVASEPVAWASIALTARDRFDVARGWLNRLKEWQQRDGSVGVGPDDQDPKWPTSLAVLSWRIFDDRSGTSEFTESADAGCQWLFSLAGHTMARPSGRFHDTTLHGWPWAEGTHSWLEPTAFAVLALRASGYQEHPRTLEAVRLIQDRQLPSGGCNYGNTFVLDQQLLPHVQPSGLAAMALASAGDDPRTRKTAAYLSRKWGTIHGTSSWCFAAMGLAAHGRLPTDFSAQLAMQVDACQARVDSRSGYKLALLALASLAADNPVIDIARQPTH